MEKLIRQYYYYYLQDIYQPQLNGIVATLSVCHWLSLVEEYLFRAICCPFFLSQNLV